MASKLSATDTLDLTKDESLEKAAAQIVRAVREATKPRPRASTVAGTAQHQPSAKLAWHGLYDDSGLLEQETQASGKPEVTAFERATPEPLERRLSRDETRERLEAYSEAKPLKPTVQMALKLARDSSATVEDLARVIKQDQALAARVLQLANSSLHRRGAPTRTIEQAIIRLGMGVLRETISSTAVLDQFSTSEGVLNIQMLWEHGYAVGMLAADLTRVTRQMSSDDAFLIGLMHDMGRAIMAGQIGQDYLDALLTARRSDIRPSRVEKAFFELNHADVADVVFRTWDFDEAVTAPIANHHLSDRNLRHLAPVHYKQTRLLKMADNLAHGALLGDSGSDWIHITDLKLDGAALSPGLVRTCVQRAAKTLEELRLMLASVPGATPPHEYAWVLREQLPQDITLATGTSTEMVDILDLLAWRLGETDLDAFAPVGGPYGPSDVPDVVLATLHTPQQVSELAHTLQAYDQSDRRVPLIVSLADEELLTGSTSLVTDRHIQVLPIEFRVAWVIRAINELYGRE
ncbi:MAG: HDOD domain-containing protein [Phycisphaerales bacterium JB064]